MSTKIRSIIFDMDGVLIDAKEWHYEALNKALALFGMEIGRYEHLVTYDGLPTKKKLEMLTIERGLPIELHDFINGLKQRYTLEMAYTRCNPVFAHQYALARIRQQGFRIAVCSNSVRDTIELMLKKADLLKYLDFYISNQDVNKPKPDPEMYLKAIHRFGFQPKECLILEDNPHGVAAAQASGANVMQVISTSDVTYQNIMAQVNFFEGN